MVWAKDQPALAATAGLMARATCYGDCRISMEAPTPPHGLLAHHVVDAHPEKRLYRSAEVKGCDLGSESSGAAG